MLENVGFKTTVKAGCNAYGVFRLSFFSSFFIGDRLKRKNHTNSNCLVHANIVIKETPYVSLCETSVSNAAYFETKRAYELDLFYLDFDL